VSTCIVNHESGQVANCLPMVAKIENMVGLLNKTNYLSGFVANLHIGGRFILM
jgi:hypothetical protein